MSSIGNILDGRFVDIPELKEQLLDLSEGFGLDVLDFAVEELFGQFLLLVLLLGGVGLVVYAAAVGQGVVHC